jgi:hypothetical protein
MPVCAVGAIVVACDGRTVSDLTLRPVVSVVQYLEQRLFAGFSLPAFNDKNGLAEVLDLFRRAAKDLRNG